MFQIENLVMLQWFKCVSFTYLFTWVSLVLSWSLLSLCLSCCWMSINSINTLLYLNHYLIVTMGFVALTRCNITEAHALVIYWLGDKQNVPIYHWTYFLQWNSYWSFEWQDKLLWCIIWDVLHSSQSCNLTSQIFLDLIMIMLNIRFL